MALIGGPAARRPALRLLLPLRQRDFALLWAARGVSLLGTGVYLVALTWQAYALWNSPAALSIVGLAWTLPFLLFVLIGGVVSDRVDRRRVMVAGDIVRSASMIVLAALALGGVLQLWQLVVISAIYAIGDALFAPASGAIVPDLVPREHLTEANALAEFTRPVALQLAGPALGGLLVAALGTGAAFALNAVTFLISALLLRRIRRAGEPAGSGTSSPRQDLVAALAFVREQRWLACALVSATLVVLVMWGPWEVLLPFVVKNEMGGGAADVGLIFAAGGLGSVVAVVAIARARPPRRPLTFMYVTSALSVLAISGYATSTEVWQAMGIAFVAGATGTLAAVVWVTLTQLHVPPSLRGRVTSLVWMATFGLLPVSYALTGPVADAFGARPTLFVAGIAGAALTLVFVLIPGALAPDGQGRRPARAARPWRAARGATMRGFAPPPHGRGALLVLAAAAGFGCCAVFAKLSYDAGFGVATLLGVRYLASAAVLGPLALSARRHGAPRLNLRPALAVAAVYVGSAGCYWLALTLGPITEVAPLVYVYPALVIVIGMVAFRERQGRLGLFAVALAIAGSALIFGVPAGGFTGLTAKALALLAALCTALYYVIGARMITSAQSLQSVFVMCVLGALTYAPTLITDLPSQRTLSEAWPFLVFLIVFGTILPLLLMQVGIARVGSTRAAVLSMLEPVVTLMLALGVLGETLGPVQLAGSLLVLASFPLASRGVRAPAFCCDRA